MPDDHKYKAVIFDCDGVLVDSEKITNAVFASMLNELGLRVTVGDTYRDFVGLSMSSCMQIIEDRLQKPIPESFEADYKSRINAALIKELLPVKGIESALSMIDIPICVASSGDHEKMRLTLGLTGLLGRFEGNIFSSMDVERGKPFPDLFLYAAKKLGVAANRCAVVEDSLPGVQAGVAAGMDVYGYCGNSDPSALSDAGATTFSDMTVLPDLLRLG